MLTREQIIENIDALERQGAPPADIQGYLDSLPRPTEIQTTLESPQPQQPQQPSFLNFLGKDFLGQATNTDAAPGFKGISEKLFQYSPLGSKGLRGQAQLLPRAIANIPYEQQAQSLDEARGNLSESATQLFKQARTLPEGPQKQKLLEMARGAIPETNNLNELARQFNATELTGKEAAGTTLNSALQSLTLGLPAGQAAPIVNLLKAKPVLNKGLWQFIKTLIPRVLTTGTESALAGTAIGLGEDQSAGQIAGNAALGFGIGAAGSAAVNSGKYFLQNVIKPIALHIVDAVVGPYKGPEATSDVIQEARSEIGLPARQTIGQKFLYSEEGKLNTGRGLVRDAVKTLNETGQKMDNVLGGSEGDKIINVVDLPEKFNEIIESLQDKFPLQAKQLEKIKNAYPEFFPTTEGNAPITDWGIIARKAANVYRSLYKLMPEKAWNVEDPNLTPAKEALKEIASELSSRVKDKVPEMAPLNFTYGLWSEVQDNVAHRVYEAAKRSILNPQKYVADAILPKLTVGFGLNKLANLGLKTQIPQAGKYGLLQAFNILNNQQ